MNKDIEKRIELAGKLMNNVIIEHCPELEITHMTKGWGDLVVGEFKKGIKEYIINNGNLSQEKIDNYIKELQRGWIKSGSAAFPHLLSGAIAYYKSGINYAKEHYNWLITGIIK